jgi:hypothetical protein
MRRPGYDNTSVLETRLYGLYGSLRNSTDTPVSLSPKATYFSLSILTEIFVVSPH